MRRLLSANFARLRRDRSFWIILAGMFLLSLAMIFSSARSAASMASRGYIRPLDKYYFVLAPYMGIVFAVFVSLFLGTEYSDGTMRNKLGVGHSRGDIFLANFFTCFSACLAFDAAWFLGGVPGWFLIGPFEMGVGGFDAYLLVVIGFTAVYAAIFTWISTLSSNKAMTILLTLGFWMLLTFLASAVNDRLCEPEMQGGMAYINGEFTMIDPTANPLYLSGAVRTLFECILDFLPTGQSILMNDASITHPVRQIIFSILATLLILPLGGRSFRRKDIK